MKHPKAQPCPVCDCKIQHRPIGIPPLANETLCHSCLTWTHWLLWEQRRAELACVQG